MYPSGLVENFLLLLGISIGIVALCRRIRLPSLLGFVLTGILIGPHGFDLIRETRQIQLLAEIGIVLLLFSLGIEFSMERLRDLHHYVFKVGGLQVGLTMGITTFGCLSLKYPIAQAILIGLVVSLSSTAVGFKLIQQRKELDSPHGRISLGILLFQDLLVPLFVLVVPLLGAFRQLAVVPLLLRLGEMLGALIAIFLIARLALPIALRWIVTVETPEVSVLGSLFVALFMGVLTQKLGLSPALGAFLAGIIISETPYTHQIRVNITPFRDGFLSLFFITIGLLIDLPFLLQHIGEAIGWTALIMVIKSLVILMVVRFIGYPLRIGILSAVYLTNIGEFSFLLLTLGYQQQVISAALYQGLLITSALTIMLAPLLVLGTRRFEKWFFPLHSQGGESSHPQPERLTDHVIIVGYGLNGRNLARILREVEVPYVVIELNGAVVQEAVQRGEMVLYGDAAHPEVLEAAGIRRARAVIFAMSDPVAARYAVDTAQRLNRDAYLLVRTRYVSEIDPLYRAGADEVIPEEFEAFLTIVARLLGRYGVSQETIEAISRIYREEHYGVLQEHRALPEAVLPEPRKELTTRTFWVPEGSPLVGRDLRELNLRRRTGVTVIAVNIE
ncbi:MAG: cation:proton antiporter, partial [candidate division WOR-3 bacterium]